jgi:hypothetical protein
MGPYMFPIGNVIPDGSLKFVDSFDCFPEAVYEFVSVILDSPVSLIAVWVHEVPPNLPHTLYR